jgi:hypothetical protein
MASSGSNQSVKAFRAGSAIARGLALKKGSSDQYVAKASAGSDKVFGVSNCSADAEGDPIEVCMDGPTKVKLGAGGGVAGDKMVADANGALVVSTTANDRIVCILDQDGVEGDIVSANMALSNL